MKVVNSPWLVRSCQPVALEMPTLSLLFFFFFFLNKTLLSAVFCVRKFFSHLLSDCLNNNVLNQCYLNNNKNIKI